MTWYVGSDEVESRDGIEQYLGFVYIITNTKTGRKYIGQKVFENARRKPALKGSSKVRKVKVEEWQGYYGSSADLLTDVKAWGKDNFKREMIRFCETKAELNYYESKEIFLRDAVLDPNYYNKWVACKVSAHQLTKYIVKWIKKNNASKNSPSI